MPRRTPGRSFPSIAARAVIACLLGIAPRQAAAQPYTPAAGEGAVSGSYQFIASSGQRGIDFSPEPPLDTTRTHAFIWYVEYGLTDRIAVHASLPAMMVRYEGPTPHTIGVHGPPNNIDDGTYHGGFQDFYFGTRFKLLQSPRFALTPFVEAIIPSHHYESLGHAAVGRDLRALVVGAAVGGFAEGLLPGLYFQTRLSQAFVQEAVDIRPNRTGIDSAVGYFVTPRLALQFVQTFQYVYDGIDWTITSPFILAVHDRSQFTRDHGLNHDRLARSNFLNFGGGVTFAITESVGVLQPRARWHGGNTLYVLSP